MSNTNTPLHLAIQNGNIEIVKILLENQCDFHAVNPDGLTPLQLATQTGNAEIVSMLLRHGVGLNPKAIPPSPASQAPPQVNVSPTPPPMPTDDPFEGLGPATVPAGKVDPKILKITTYV